MDKIKTYAVSILIPVLIGVIVGLVAAPGADYLTLEKPFLTPPSIVFPIVWTILYILMGVSYGMLKTKFLTDSDVDKIYYLQLTVNALWSIIFFSLKWRLVAFVWIVLLAGLVIKMILKFYDKDRVAGLLQIPYIIWVLFASYLNLAFYILNK